MQSKVKVIKLSSLALLTFFATGCATITRGTNETLVVKSTPDGAQVKLTSTSGKMQTCAATPCTFVLPRRSDVVVLIEKDGFSTVRAQVRGRLRGFVPLGVIGAAVDVASGAALRLDPNPLDVVLTLGSGQVDYVAATPAASTSSKP